MPGNSIVAKEMKSKSKPKVLQRPIIDRLRKDGRIPKPPNVMKKRLPDERPMPNKRVSMDLLEVIENKPVEKAPQRDYRSKADNHRKHRSVYSGIEEPASFRCGSRAKSAAGTRYVNSASEQPNLLIVLPVVKMPQKVKCAIAPYRPRRSARQSFQREVFDDEAGT